MPKKIRRLLNIQTDEVSLVDRAANLRKFCIVKNQEGDGIMEEIIKKIEKALNTVIEKMADFEKRLDAQEPTEAELQKAGAKFSKATMSQLKAVHTAIGQLLGGTNLSDGSGKPDSNPTEKGMTNEAFATTFGDAIKKSMAPKDEKKPDSPEALATLIKTMVTAALKDVEK